MIAFAVASALVKLYADEADAAPVRSADTLVVCALSRVEVASALWRKHRLDELDSDLTRLLVHDFEADWYGTDDEPARFVIVSVTSAILERAAQVTAVHALRSGDALQLAAALTARAVEPACDSMLVFDEALRRAAAREGFGA